MAQRRNSESVTIDIPNRLSNNASTQPFSAPAKGDRTDKLNDPYGHLSQKQRDFRNAQYIALNTFSTITTVFLNKITFEDKQMRELQVINAIWHFLTTFIVLIVACNPPFNVFPGIWVPTLEMLPICTFFAGFLVLNNLSLTYNSVGFYQLAKILTTPCVVLLNYLILRKTISRYTLTAVLISCVGIALTNGDSAQSNPFGAMLATGAFIVTALYQIWIGKKMKDLEVSAPQLLLNQSPVASILLLFIVPFFDTWPNVATIPPRVGWAFFFSGIVASLINLSQFLIIEGTSVLTFNIVGLVKTIVIVSVGWYTEGKQPDLKDLIGVILALSGAWAYGQLSTREVRR